MVSNLDCKYCGSEVVVSLAFRLASIVFALYCLRLVRTCALKAVITRLGQGQVASCIALAQMRA
eukprot:2458482-Amphidinium_carterae.1